ncbi:MAG: Ig-like domain-containing protein [Bacteroidaceae bacterium]
MDKKKQHYYINRLMQLLTVLMVGCLLYACANVGRPDGGPIDETPPRFLESNPNLKAVNNTKKKIMLNFDENIKVEKISENVVVSPPQIKTPEIVASGKNIRINLNDSLIPNTTYTVDFTDAIVDNNEGNPLGNFTYSFSTGDKIDTLEVSGYILNAEDLEPIKGMLVGLYSNLSDTAFTTLPFQRVGRTDSRGHFVIRGIAPGKYHAFGLKDNDQNYYFSQVKENIAFSDSIFIPSSKPDVRQDTTMIDSITIDTIRTVNYIHYYPDDIVLRSFLEKDSFQYLKRTSRPFPWQLSIQFAVEADTFPKLRGLDCDLTDAFVIEKTAKLDSLIYWIKDTTMVHRDTLTIEATYMATDTLNQLVSKTDTVLFAVPNKYKRKEKEEEKKEEEKKKKQEEDLQALIKTMGDSKGGYDKIHQQLLANPVDSNLILKDSLAFTDFKLAEKEKTIFEAKMNEPKMLDMKVDMKSPLDVYGSIHLLFKEPVASIDSLGIHLKEKVDTLWQEIDYKMVHDENHLLEYTLYTQWKPETEYSLTVDSMAFVGLYGTYTRKEEKTFKTHKLEDYGEIYFNVTGVKGPAFVQLLDPSDKVIRQQQVKEGKADFYYLEPAKYGARLVVDANNNNLWDIGNYAKGIAPEMVYYYSTVIELKAQWELEQDWDVHEIPLFRQKPSEMVKQKPEERKKKSRTSKRSQSNNRRN